MSSREDIRAWAEKHWSELNQRVGSCPECTQMNEDLSRLALRASRTGVTLSASAPVGVVDFASVFKDWPEPILDKDAIIDLHPLTVECQTCGTEYEPQTPR